MRVEGLASILKLIAAFAGVLATASQSSGQAPDNPVLAAQVEAWVQRTWRESEHVPTLPAGLAFRIEYKLVPSDEELERLRQEVTGKPEHPRKHELAQFQERLGGKPTIQRFVLFADGNDRWRSCFSSGDTWIDAAVNGETGWTLNASVLSVFQLGDPSKAEGGDPRSERNVFSSTVSKLLDGGFGQAARGGLTPGRLTLKADQWTFRAGSVPVGGAEVSDFEISFHGRWDRAAGRGFVERMQFLGEHPLRDAFGTEVRFSGWHQEPALGRWVAERADSFFGDARADASWVLEGAVPLSSGGLDGVLRIPEPGMVDPVRGKLAFRSIFDYRDRSVREIQGGVEVPVGEIAPSGTDTDSRDRWLRPAGWLIILGSVALFVWVRFARRAPG